MRKKNAKTLGLNKKAISNLQVTEIKGGRLTVSYRPTCFEESCKCIDDWRFKSIVGCPL